MTDTCTVEALYCGHLGDIASKVSSIERCPHFRGKFLLRKHIWKLTVQSVVKQFT